MDIPLIRQKLELIGSSIDEVEGRTIKLDLTRQLKGKGVEATFKIDFEDNKITVKPRKILLMPFFIRRMIRNRISYVEDSFIVPSQESMIKIKPFLIARRKVSRRIKTRLKPKRIDILSTTTFGHHIINILPIYTDETLSSRRQAANKEELEEVEKLLKAKPKVQSSKPRTSKAKKSIIKKIEKTIKKFEEKLWLPQRIP